MILTIFFEGIFWFFCLRRFAVTRTTLECVTDLRLLRDEIKGWQPAADKKWWSAFKLFYQFNFHNFFVVAFVTCALFDHFDYRRMVSSMPSSGSKGRGRAFNRLLIRDYLQVCSMWIIELFLFLLRLFSTAFIAFPWREREQSIDGSSEGNHRSLSKACSCLWPERGVWSASISDSFAAKDVDDDAQQEIWSSS